MIVPLKSENVHYSLILKHLYTVILFLNGTKKGDFCIKQ